MNKLFIKERNLLQARTTNLIKGDKNEKVSIFRDFIRPIHSKWLH